MPYDTPEQLAEAFKTSPEFDGIRKQLFSQFRDSGNFASFMDSVDEKGKEMVLQPRMGLVPQDRLAQELRKEFKRFPIVERAIDNMLRGPSFSSSVHESVQKLYTRKDEAPPTLSRPAFEQIPEAVDHTLATTIRITVGNTVTDAAQIVGSSDDPMHDINAQAPPTPPTSKPSENGSMATPTVSGNSAQPGADDLVSNTTLRQMAVDQHVDELPNGSRAKGKANSADGRSDEEMELSSPDLAHGGHPTTTADERGSSSSMTRSSSPLSEEGN